MRKDIKNYEGLYAVTDDGQVWSYWKNDFRAPKNGVRGYITVNLCKEGKCTTYDVHKLVAKTFLPPEEGKTQVNHKDGNKKNNNTSNLEWVTQAQNTQHAYNSGLARAAHGEKQGHTKLTTKQVRLIRVSREKVRDLVSRYGVSDQTIRNIRDRKTWIHTI